jgi:guanylate cyclase
VVPDVFSDKSSYPHYYFGLPLAEIIEKVGNPPEGCTIRPPTRHLDVSESVLKCLHACWEEDPELRPDFRYIRVRLKEMQTGL